MPSRPRLPGKQSVALLPGDDDAIVTSNKRFNPLSLDAVNFLLADVRGAPAIDLNRARDLHHKSDGPEGTAAGYSILFKSRSLFVFGVCVMLFHFANAALLPLVGQKLAAAFPKEATAMMSACIIAAQLVMLPIALVVGNSADSWGRKPILLVGFALLPIRAVLYTFFR